MGGHASNGAAKSLCPTHITETCVRSKRKMVIYDQNKDESNKFCLYENLLSLVVTYKKWVSTQWMDLLGKVRKSENSIL
jgi:hypothetical protein